MNKVSSRLLHFACLAAVWAATGSAFADKLSLSFRSGLNYETAVITSRVTEASSGATLTLRVTDPQKGTTTSTFSGDLTERVATIPNRTAAQTLAIDGYVVGADGTVTNAASHGLLLMGASHDDKWMLETPETFRDESGTGVWTGREYARAEEGLIKINTTNGLTEASVGCQFGLVPGLHRGFTIETDVTFPSIFPEAPDATGQILGLTIAVDDSDAAESAFGYVENGDWTFVPPSVCDATAATNWQVRISVDCDASKATYFVRASATNAWTLLGTAQNVDGTSVSAAMFKGEGAIAGLKGNGFDADLIRVGVEFASDNLKPGCNFEDTVVTGRLVSTIVHETDRTTGTYQVRLTDLDGGVLASSEYEFAVGEEMGFSIEASELTAGDAYRAEVAVSTTGELSLTNSWRTGVMARMLTNVLWSATNLWVYENAKTFDKLLPGTGEWELEPTSASTAGDWIQIHTFTNDEASADDAYVTFRPTNAVDEAISGYISGIRAVFSESVVAPSAVKDAVFGMTVGSENDDDDVSFLCLSNRVWRAVPHSVAVPTFGVEYEYSVHVQKSLSKLRYLLKLPTGEQVLLMTVNLDFDIEDVFDHVEISGTGKVTDLTGEPYSTDLVRVHVDFDESVTMYPSTNFEATAANGIIRFEKLWETDRTSGKLRIVVRDKYGAVVGQRRINFHDLSDQPFEYYVTGLTPGENYTVDVVAEMQGVDASSQSNAEGLMARVVTNGVWATDGWIRENADTFAKREGAVPSGVWTDGGMATVEGDVISIDTQSGTGETDSFVDFHATNDLPRHTGFELRNSLMFDLASGELPAIDGAFGLTVMETEGSVYQETADYCFAIISNGVWMAIDPETYAPQLKVQYELTIRVDYKRGLVCYQIQSEKERKKGTSPTVLAEFELADLGMETPEHVDYYGIGRIRTLEGDGFDVTLLESSLDLETPLVPGTNFTATVVKGVLHLKQIWLTDRTSGNVTVRIRDASGRIVRTLAVSYDELKDRDFCLSVEGLDAGAVYDVEVVSDLVGDVLADDTTSIVMARRLGGWIREDAETFVGEDVGTGLWLETNETAYVVETETGRAIEVSVHEDSLPVTFCSTNDSLSVRKSTVREFRFDLDFDSAGWYQSSTNIPPSTSNLLAGATVWCDDSDETVTNMPYAIAVITTNGTWRILEDTVGLYTPETRASVRVLIDYANGFVRYDLETAESTNRLYQYGFAPFAPAVTNIVSFSGSGHVWALDGDAWDPNLIASSTNEFADLDSAIIGTAGEDETLSPLWWADQLVTVGKGTFRIYDPKNWLTVRFPDWYYVVITGDGDVKVYRFNQSNNWIDYAESGDANVETNGDFFLVKTPEGLSWIAALATNEWVSGRIALATNIDLTLHNWTPIAGFSGSFDGRGWKISGLNNTNLCFEIPNGTYLSGPTNDWGRSAYGLFGTATNATLSDVTFAGVAVSNFADSVATLVGSLAGDCTVSNVTVESGSVFGLGETVAGLAAYADFANILTFVNNTNRADVAAGTLPSDEGAGRYAAGVLCLAGPTNETAALGTVVVTNNVNFGVITNTIYDADLMGGNVAQILAGTTYGARFGDVYLTGNEAKGTVKANLVRSQENEIAVAALPVVNLASAFWGYEWWGFEDGDCTFKRFLEANDAGAVAVDPVHRTARMLSDLYENGTTNVIGIINDRITATPADGTVTLTGNLDSWGAILLDRNLTFDLGGYTNYTVYVNNTFDISDGVVATVRNGTIYTGPESQPFAGDTSHLTEENLHLEEVPYEFFDRTQVMLYTLDNPDGEPLPLFGAATAASLINASGTVIELFSDGDVEIDVDVGTLNVNGHVVAQLSDCYSFVKATDGKNVRFEVRIVDSAAPTADFSMTGGESGQVTVKVGNAKDGFWYALQHKNSLMEEWVTPPEEEWVQATSEGATLTAPTDGEQGYYRVLMSDVPVSSQDE